MKSDEIWKLKLSAAISDFQDRIISDEVFLGCLYSAGFRGTRLREEFNYQFGIRHDIEKHHTLDGKLSLSHASSSASSGSS